MTSILSLVPSATLKIFQFGDVDDFQRAVRKFEVEFTPLGRRISARQAVLQLPGLDLSLMQSIPRLADIWLAPGCSAICFSMDHHRLIRFNGIDVDKPLIVLGHGGDRFATLEEAEARSAAIVFTPGGTYVLTMYAHRDETMLFDEANRLIISVARAVYNYYNPG